MDRQHYKKEWYQNSRERIRRDQAEYYQRNKERLIERNNTQQKARVRDYTIYYRRRREAILQALGSQCKQCGFSDVRALHIDHINGGGRKERDSFKGKLDQYYRYVLENLESGKYQLLCANCNAIKIFEEKEHQKALDLRNELLE